MFSNSTLEVIYSIVFTALIMTIFEICFAHVIVFPGLKGVVGHNLNRIKPKADPSNTASEAFMRQIAIEEVRALLSTLKVREEQRLNKINNHSKVFSIVLILVLFTITITVVILRLKRSPSVSATYTLGPSTVHSIITISALIVFQYSFYRMSLRYQYTSMEEMIPIITNQNCSGVYLSQEETDMLLKLFEESGTFTQPSASTTILVNEFANAIRTDVFELLTKIDSAENKSSTPMIDSAKKIMNRNLPSA